MLLKTFSWKAYKIFNYLKHLITKLNLNVEELVDFSEFNTNTRLHKSSQS